MNVIETEADVKLKFHFVNKIVNLTGNWESLISLLDEKKEWIIYSHKDEPDKLTVIHMPEVLAIEAEMINDDSVLQRTE